MRTHRLAIITVGRTHSGKTTCAKALEAHLDNSIVIDQDNHAEFVNAHYMLLRPKEGPNTLKYAVTHTIVDYAVRQTDAHLILCNANLAREGRTELLDYFRGNAFTTIIVYFDIPDDVLQQRVAESQRSKAIFRSASTFEEVLLRQQSSEAPDACESNYFFVIRSSEQVPDVIGHIVQLRNIS
jgi:tRNA uridine 5-carbamoylmethylation protein Kti12